MPDSSSGVGSISSCTSTCSIRQRTLGTAIPHAKRDDIAPSRMVGLSRANRMALERTGAIGLVALLAGCGDGGSGSPTEPTGMAGLALEPGSYVVVATAQSTIPPITAGCIGT